MRLAGLGVIFIKAEDRTRPVEVRYGCYLSVLTGLAKTPPAPTFRYGI